MAAQVALALEGARMLNNHVLPMVRERMGQMEGRDKSRAQEQGFEPSRLQESLNSSNMSNLKPEEAQALQGAMMSLQQMQEGNEQAPDAPSRPQTGMQGPGF